MLLASGLPPRPRMLRQLQLREPPVRRSLRPYYDDEYSSFYDETERNFRVDEESLRFLGSLPVGCRFFPAEKELVASYLRPKVENRPLPPNKIVEADVYQHSPMGLAERYRDYGEGFWMFFSPRDRKYERGKRPNRAARGGYWKPNGRAVQIGVNLGFKRVMAYHLGNPPCGTKTNWIMHEYWLEEDSHPAPSHGPNLMRLNDWVLCKIYERPQPKINGHATDLPSIIPGQLFSEEDQAAPETQPAFQGYKNGHFYQLVPVEYQAALLTEMDDYPVYQHLQAQPTPSCCSLLHDHGVPINEGIGRRQPVNLALPGRARGTDDQSEGRLRSSNFHFDYLRRTCETPHAESSQAQPARGMSSYCQPCSSTQLQPTPPQYTRLDQNVLIKTGGSTLQPVNFGHPVTHAMHYAESFQASLEREMFPIWQPSSSMSTGGYPSRPAWLGDPGNNIRNRYTAKREPLRFHRQWSRSLSIYCSEIRPGLHGGTILDVDRVNRGWQNWTWGPKFR